MKLKAKVKRKAKLITKRGKVFSHTVDDIFAPQAKPALKKILIVEVLVLRN